MRMVVSNRFVLSWSCAHVMLCATHCRAARTSASAPMSIIVSRASTKVNPRLNHFSQVLLTGRNSSCPQHAPLCACVMRGLGGCHVLVGVPAEQGCLLDALLSLGSFCDACQAIVCGLRCAARDRSVAYPRCTLAWCRRCQSCGIGRIRRCLHRHAAAARGVVHDQGQCGGSVGMFAILYCTNSLNAPRRCESRSSGLARRNRTAGYTGR